MTEETLEIKSIGQIAITVQDLEAATAFYRDVLGIKLLFEVPGMSFFDLGGVRLMMAPPEREEFDHPASILYYRVDDIEVAHRVLLSRGVTFERGPELIHKAEDHDLWLAFFRDMDGNFMSLMEEKRPS